MSSLPPWHLWGQISTVSLNASVALGVPGQFGSTQQLARIQYIRPESWNFLFFANLVAGFGFGGGLDHCDIFFDLILGLGRSSIVIPNFEHFQFGLATDVGQQRFSTSVAAPLRFPGDTNANLIHDVTAETINCNARVVLANTGTNCTVEISAQFAPIVHTRPEWHEQRFPGGETEGH